MRIGVSPDLIIIERSLYTTLDFFSDMGGLSEILFRVTGILISFLKYDIVGKYMVKRLFKVD